MIEEGARLASDNSKLSIEVGRIADIVREADYWASEAKHDVITRADIDAAVDAHIQRSDRLRDKSNEGITRDIMLVGTDGSVVGQINGLSVLSLGDFAFGKPTRITARVRMGAGRVTDIEREVNLGGPLHSKGVMILWGFLAGRFAQDVPLALAASLVFEQSYGGVDGDSASSTELYALLSALVGCADQAVLRGHGLGQSARRGAGDRRRQREDRGLLRYLQGARADGRSRCSDSAIERAASDAARGCRAGRAGRQIPHPRRLRPSIRASRS